MRLKPTALLLCRADPGERGVPAQALAQRASRSDRRVWNHGPAASRDSTDGTVTFPSAAEQSRADSLRVPCAAGSVREGRRGAGEAAVTQHNANLLQCPPRLGRRVRARFAGGIRAAAGQRAALLGPWRDGGSGEEVGEEEQCRAGCGGRGRWSAPAWLSRLLGEKGDGFVLRSPREQSLARGPWAPRTLPVGCSVPGEGWEDSGCQPPVRVGRGRTRRRGEPSLMGTPVRTTAAFPLLQLPSPQSRKVVFPKQEQISLSLKHESCLGAGEAPKDLLFILSPALQSQVCIQQPVEQRRWEAQPGSSLVSSAGPESPRLRWEPLTAAAGIGVQPRGSACAPAGRGAGLSLCAHFRADLC